MVDVYVMDTLLFALHRLKILIFCNVNVNITLLDSIVTNALKDMYRNGMLVYKYKRYLTHLKFSILTNIDKIILHKLFFFVRWRPNTALDPFKCEKCNCNGHSDKCHFDEEVRVLTYNNYKN